MKTYRSNTIVLFRNTYIRMRHEDKPQFIVTSILVKTCTLSIETHTKRRMYEDRVGSQLTGIVFLEAVEMQG